MENSRMKVFIVLLAITALAAARPGRGGRGGHKRERPCRVLYQNGTVVENACDAPGALIECEPVVDIEEYVSQKIERLADKAARFIPDDGVESFINNMTERINARFENVRELSICRAIRCSNDVTCTNIDSNSVCTNDFEPDLEAMQTLKSQCFPDRQSTPRIPRADDDDEDDDNDRPFRCSLPAAYRLAKKACSMTRNGVTTTEDCRRGTCSTNSCSFSLDNRATTASFCEGGRRGRGRGGRRGGK